jgi:hypothetical protein
MPNSPLQRGQRKKQKRNHAQTINAIQAKAKAIEGASDFVN